MMIIRNAKILITVLVLLVSYTEWIVARFGDEPFSLCEIFGTQKGIKISKLIAARRGFYIGQTIDKSVELLSIAKT